ncbi:MAG: DUF481 domain-containing protein [Gemmatimonadetes bacterium]|uniref:DUF481 domain-containing protein n=1 Tax=Candidatus Kutchimonas denitrificans TaxID=3056748 RepID=A0AAE4ZCI2_9BACT|nr:DUF481 domain-containing protein [Gemmatimonadota bacterium]NIR75190.1 DUF481 domain-containing protein [Candidatus Kutchimonas denitrificans]NIS00128.1 DUF481 domain-containing protein [Gemmatimonadota bacterium]NIT65720.1 DUF481 domain-containing protein [Gemmatimonadota bacterium]NIU52998.1 DUF481 domain-containing protein [Gemmatimonadota bacterium]
MNSVVRALTLSASLLAAATGSANGQEAGAAESEALRVFMDCRSRFCDFDFFRREIRFVNYVRDRRDAQVHILVTTRRTGGGGDEFTIELIGRQDLAGHADTLYYFSSDTDTEDEIRTGLTRTIRLGLVRYSVLADATRGLEVVYDAPDTATTEAQVPYDPWDYWIFRIRVGGNLRGEELQSGFQGNMSLSANRTTEDWKIETGLNGFYAEDEFELSDDSTVTSFARDYGGWFFIARSVSEHWSVGSLMEGGTSTFRNYDLRSTIGPGIEYNIFPYSESTRRELTFRYFVAVNYYDYEEITIFDETTEFRPSQSLEVSYSLRQPFGTVSVSVEGSHFLDEPKQHRIDLRGWLNIRLVRGLQLNLNGSFSRIKDQIFLSREGATDEEVLLRRRELGTDFRYRLGFSLSYTFGSIFNNVVNPRFD